MPHKPSLQVRGFAILNIIIVIIIVVHSQVAKDRAAVTAEVITVFQLSIMIKTEQKEMIKNENFGTIKHVSYMNTRRRKMTRQPEWIHDESKAEAVPTQSRARARAKRVIEPTPDQVRHLTRRSTA